MRVFTLMSFIVLGLVVASSAPRDRMGTAVIGAVAITLIVSAIAVRRHLAARRAGRPHR